MRQNRNKENHQLNIYTGAGDMNAQNYNAQNIPQYNNQQYNINPNITPTPGMEGDQYYSSNQMYTNNNNNNHIHAYQEPLNLKKQRQNSANHSIDSQSVSSRQSPLRKTINDYEFSGLGQLGQGSYGTVRLAYDKQSKDRVAIKIMTKAQIFKFCTVENLKREIKIQKRMIHPNICKLFHFFEDKQNVYLVLEYAQRGNLFNVLRKASKMDESVAFWYFYQTCLGIDHLHRHKIIHRDLKPENLLVDQGNNIKVCDFGWSAENSNNSIRTTFCGTIDYMAPEMVKRATYDHRIDIWSLGVLLYELVHGYAPFQGNNQHQKLDNIMKNKPVQFRPNLEYDLVDLIKNILQPNPDYRLSMEQIFDHPWMHRQYKKMNIDIHSVLQTQEARLNTVGSMNSFSSFNNLDTTLKERINRAETMNDRKRNYSNHSSNNYKKSNTSYDDKRRMASQNARSHNDEYQFQGIAEVEEPNLMQSGVYERIKIINNKNRQAEESESFFDKIMIAFGCIQRDKSKRR